MPGAVAARDEWELPAEPASVSFIRGQVKAFAQEHGVRAEEVIDLTLAVTEAVTNSVLHAATRVVIAHPVTETLKHVVPGVLLTIVGGLVSLVGVIILILGIVRRRQKVPSCRPSPADPGWGTPSPRRPARPRVGTRTHPVPASATGRHPLDRPPSLTGLALSPRLFVPCSACWRFG